MQTETTSSPQPNWLQILLVGKNPRRTAVRLCVLICASVVVFKFILLPIRISGISMLPTYHTGQFNCVYRLAYLRHAPRRGDVISVRFAKPDGLSAPSVMLMKRIIGLPGETVSFQDGRAFINGKMLDEPYVKLYCDWTHDRVTCGPDEFYFVGDNRSMPIEMHMQGRAKLERIVGRLLL